MYIEYNILHTNEPFCTLATTNLTSDQLIRVRVRAPAIYEHLIFPKH